MQVLDKVDVCVYTRKKRGFDKCLAVLTFTVGPSPFFAIEGERESGRWSAHLSVFAEMLNTQKVRS